MADDDLDDQFLVKKAIEEISACYMFTSVNNGSQLLDLLTRSGQFKNSMHTNPDCILLDLNMPLMDGFTALDRLKNLKELSHIPVYILSTTRNPADQKRSMLLGASDFYVKPAKYSDLKAILSDICDKVSGRATVS